jgi:predicted transcriptional regulator
MRTIADYMTKQPWSVQIDDSIAVALRMLAEREIHHLPVLDGGRLVGMVVDRGLLAKTPDRDGTVERVMTSAAEVEAETPLADALDVMSERERDALVVTRDGEIVGIFTAMDAVRVLRDRTRTRPRA